MSSKFNSKFKFKRHPVEKRQNECRRIRYKHPDRVPVIVERSSTSRTVGVDTNSSLAEIDKSKFLAPNDLTVGQFVYMIRKRIRLAPEKAIFMFVNGTLPPTAMLMSQLYREHSDPEDDFLYVMYSDESTFGHPDDLDRYMNLNLYKQLQTFPRIIYHKIMSSYQSPSLSASVAGPSASSSSPPEIIAPAVVAYLAVQMLPDRQHSSLAYYKIAGVRQRPTVMVYWGDPNLSMLKQQYMRISRHESVDGDARYRVETTDKSLGLGNDLVSMNRIKAIIMEIGNTKQIHTITMVNGLNYKSEEATSRVTLFHCSANLPLIANGEGQSCNN